MLSACGDRDAAGPSGGEAYTCEAQIAAKTVRSFTGEARDADPARAEEAAWTAACAQLPDAERPACRDAARFAAQRTTTPAGDGTTHAAKVTLTEIAATFTGEGGSQQSVAAACDAARAAACAAAGATAGCVEAGGAFTQTGVASSTRRPGD